MGKATDAERQQLSSGTGLGLLEFLDWVVDRGELVKATGGALRTGVKKVLDTDPDLAAADVRAIDVDDVVRRFRTKARGSAKDTTIDQYEQRFRQSVEMYRRWLAEDPNWLPARSRTATAKARANGKVDRASVGEQPSGSALGVVPPDAPTSRSGLVTYPLPLRPGLKATLILPEDLSSAEASRIAAFVSAVAFDGRHEEAGGRDGSFIAE